MKYEIDERTELFTPITITLTLETKEELIELWKRLNASSSLVDKGSLHSYDRYPTVDAKFWDLWKSLNDILDK